MSIYKDHKKRNAKQLSTLKKFIIFYLAIVRQNLEQAKTFIDYN